MSANQEFEKYCKRHPKTAKEMAEFIKYAKEVGILSSTPTGSDIATLCRAYQDGRRRYLRQLSEKNIAKYECERDLREQGVEDDSLIETTCSPIEEPSFEFTKKEVVTEPVEKKEQRKKISLLERSRSSLEKARKKVTEKIEKRREKKEEEASCVRRVMVTGKNRRDAERFCKK